MKKLSILFLLTASVLFWSCSGHSGKKKSTGKQASEVKEVKPILKVPTLTVRIGDKESKFDSITIIRTGATGQNGDWDICAGATGENGGKCVVGLEFSANAPGTVEDVSIDLDGYKVEKGSLVLEAFKTQKSIGRVKLVSLKGTFSGKAKKRNSSGFPEGESIDFSGTIEK